MLKVKVVGVNTRKHFSKQFPNENAIWGNCHFTFDLLEKEYDWLVAVDNIPRIWPWRGYKLSCPSDQTIFVATEPSSISYYGAAFTGQFAYLITNQDANTLPHKNAIRTQPGNHWFYEKTYGQIYQDGPYPKSKLFSAIASHKAEKHTLHHKRFKFI